MKIKIDKEKLKKNAKKVGKVALVGGSCFVAVAGVYFARKHRDKSDTVELVESILYNSPAVSKESHYRDDLGAFDTWEEPREYAGIVYDTTLSNLGPVGSKFAELIGIPDDAECGVTIEVLKHQPRIEKAE